MGGIAVVDKCVHDMLFKDTFCSANVFENAVGGYGIKLCYLFDHFLCAGGAYLAGSAADTLQTVGLLGSIAEDMYLSAPFLIPCGKLHTRDGKHAVSFSKHLCSGYGRHSIVIGDRYKINSRAFRLDNDILYTERTVGQCCMTVKIAFHFCDQSFPVVFRIKTETIWVINYSHIKSIITYHAYERKCFFIKTAKKGCFYRNFSLNHTSFTSNSRPSR